MDRRKIVLSALTVLVVISLIAAAIAIYRGITGGDTGAFYSVASLCSLLAMALMLVALNMRDPGRIDPKTGQVQKNVWEQVREYEESEGARSQDQKNC